MKDLRTPYFLDDSLPNAVRQYLEENISCDLDDMTEYLMNTYHKFENKNPRLFKSSVEKAYNYVMETQLAASKKVKKSAGTPTQSIASNSSPSLASRKMKDVALNSASPAKQTNQPKYLSNNTSDHLNSCLTPVKEVSNNSTSKKRSEKKRHLQNQRKSMDKPAFNTDDFFVIDVDCDDTDNKNTGSDDIEIVHQQTQKLPEKTPVKKKLVVEESEPTEAAPIKKRRVLEKDVDLGYLAMKKDYQDFTQCLQRVTFDQLGGLEPITKDVLKTLCLLQQPEMRPLTRLVSGPPGCGKTALVSAMAQAAGLPVINVSVAEIMSGSSLSPEKKMTEALLQAFNRAPAMVLISQLDRLGRETGSSGLGSRQAEAMTTAVQSALNYLQCCMAGAQVLVVAECSQAEVLDQQLMDCFRRHITIKPPTATHRVQILKCVCSKRNTSPDIDYSHLGLKCSGFVAGDFVRLVDQAMEIAAERCSVNSLPQSLVGFNISNFTSPLPEVCLTNDDLLKAAKVVRPVLKKEGFPAIPDTTWQDVGGLVTTRDELRRRMLDPISDPDLAAKYNRTTSGILLWGPPGCGKTLLAKAVANEAGINLLIVNGPSLLSMYQGESERAVRVVFARAASVAPCVIFFDEFDSLCPRRSNSGTESGSKSTIVNMLLTEMNGFMERAGVYVMAATNRPAILDPAVLRPGRFDTLLYVGLPDLSARVAVFNAATKNGTLPALASDVDLQEIAARCEHFSGADCRHLVDTACTEAIEELRTWRRTTQSALNCPSLEEDTSMDEIKVDCNSIEGVTAVTSEMALSASNSGCIIEHPDQCESPETRVNNGVSNGALNTTNKPLRFENNEESITCIEEHLCQERQDEEESLATRAESTESNGVSANPFSEGEYLLYARHFEAALKTVKPSVSEKERLKYEDQERNKKFL